jgi:hypothetical protein
MGLIGCQEAADRPRLMILISAAIRRGEFDCGSLEEVHN